MSKIIWKVRYMCHMWAQLQPGIKLLWSCAEVGLENNEDNDTPKYCVEQELACWGD